MLPLDIQMQIDLTAAAHKREIAEGFARLRAELLPEPAPDPMRAFMQSLMNTPLELQMAAGYNASPLQSGLDPWNALLGRSAFTGVGGSF